MSLNKYLVPAQDKHFTPPPPYSGVFLFYRRIISKIDGKVRTDI